MPEEVPIALTAAFSADAGKQALWEALLRKGRLDVGGKTLGEVIGELREFLLPPVFAIASNELFMRKWECSGEWK